MIHSKQNNQEQNEDKEFMEKMNNYNAGANAVKNLKVGDRFFGSMGAADREANGDKFFELGYRHGLPNEIWVNDEGIITKLDW